MYDLKNYNDLYLAKYWGDFVLPFPDAKLDAK